MRSTKTIVPLLLVVLTLWAAACSQSSKDHYIKKEVFSKALQELLVIRFLNIDDTLKTALTARVLKKYHITKKEFEATKAHYAQKPQFWEEVFKTIEKRLEQENSRIQEVRKHGQSRKRKIPGN